MKKLSQFKEGLNSYKDISFYLKRKSKKNLNIRINAKNEIEVSIPPKAKDDLLIEFLDANLEKFLEGLKCYEPSIMSQLSDLVLPLCLNSYIEDKQFMAETVVESIIHWVIDDVDITKQTELLSKVFSNNQTDFH